VGPHSVIVTPEMVGQRLAVFAAVEVKDQKKYPTKTQRDWLAVVSELGGYAGVARSVDEARAILRLK
jgi:hypothetical protein